MRFFLLMLLCCTSVRLFSQNLYTPGDTTKGEKASYYCFWESDLFYNIRNVDNVDTTFTVYYVDGGVCKMDLDAYDWIAGAARFSKEQVYNVFKEIFTDEEFEKVKGYTRTIPLTIGVTADAEGNAVELYFKVCIWDNVFLGLSPDRLFALETKLKDLLKIDINQGTRKIRNQKYIVPVGYEYMK